MSIYDSYNSQWIKQNKKIKFTPSIPNKWTKVLWDVGVETFD